MANRAQSKRISRAVFVLAKMAARNVHWLFLVVCVIAAALALRMTLSQRHADDRSPPNGGSPGPAGNSEYRSDKEYRAALDSVIARCTTQEDFVRLLSGYSSNSGVWESRRFISTLNRVFEAWFAMDLHGALEGVGLIPDPSENQFSTVDMRLTALVIGGRSRFSEAPGEFYKAAGELLPEGPANAVKTAVAQAIATEDPEGFFDFVENQLGQGYDKMDAVKALFARWGKSNPREAISYVEKLSFKEDQRYAFEALAGESMRWTPAEVILAEQAGMPDDLLARVRKKQKTREDYRKKHGVDIPLDMSP
jgi:hypothetical protein